MQDIFRYIEDHLNESIAVLTELCKLPTVSAQGTAIQETAEHVVALLRGLGFEAQILPKGGGGHPVVYAELRGALRPGSGQALRLRSGQASAKTLLFYDHYDVQPPEPLELW